MKKRSFKLRALSLGVAAVTVSALLVSPGAEGNIKTVNAAIGEVGAEDETGLKEGQTSVLYDSSIGMPTSEANDIAQTEDGFIWIGSYSGLTRYDGKEFLRYGTEEDIASVVSLLVDSKGRLWVGMNDSGAIMIDKNEFVRYDRKDGLTALSVRALTEDKEGNIILGTMQGLFFVGSDGVLQRIDDERVNNNYTCELETADDGTVYGITDEGDAFIVEGLSVTEFIDKDEIAEGTLNCVLPDRDNPGYAYFGTKEDVILYGSIKDQNINKSVYKVPENENINCLYYVDDRIYICADKGIMHMEKDGTHFVKLQKVAMTNSVDKMIEDFEGNLWFTSSRQGVMKITTSIFTNVSRIAALPDIVANTTCIWQGKLYIGTDDGLILLDEDRRQMENELTEALKETRIRSIKVDSNNNMLICTYSDHGLMVCKPDGTIEDINTDSGLVSNRIRTVTELSNGDYFVSTNSGVQRIENGVPKEVYNSKNLLSSDEMLTICEDFSGNIFLGGNGDGIHVLNKDGSVTDYGIDDGLKSEVILRIKKDPYREVLWIVTSNSIAFYKDGMIETVNKFPYPNNFDIFSDSHGGIWVLGSNGVYNTTAEEMLKNEDIEYVHYDSKAGLPHVTTGNSRNFIDDNGNLYIAGTTGITELNINESHDSKKEVKLTVPYLDVDGETVFIEDGRVKVKSDAMRITIYGYALSYTLNNADVRYMLKGFDNGYVNATKSTLEPVEYTNLAGGTYVYHLAVIDSITGEEENEVDITIEKEKKLNELWWFRILLVIVIATLVALVVGMIFRRRAKEAEKREAEKQRFIDEMVNAFAKIIDIKDRYTNGHSFRVAKYTSMLSRELGKSESEINRIKNIAMLHDIGKISIPDEILNKPEGLNDEEYEIMKTHASVGYDVLKEITADPDLAVGAGFHHERLDGNGYPFKKAGEEIPEVARIIAVADTFDAMYSTRPYRKKMELSECVKRIKEAAGTQLDPVVVDAFVRLYEAGELKDDSVK